MQNESFGVASNAIYDQYSCTIKDIVIYNN